MKDVAGTGKGERDEPTISSGFALAPDEKVKHGFARLLGELAMRARRLAPPAGRAGSESVHEARLLIKRLRALLWFARPAFSSAKVKRAKARLQEAAHLLAGQRDLAVLHSVLGGLSRQPGNDAQRILLASLVHGSPVLAEKPEPAVAEAVALLLATLQRLKRAAALAPRWPAPESRLNKSFTSMKRAGDRALRKADPARWHEWRKKSKKHLYLLELTEATAGRGRKRARRQVDKLQERLGEYHDCVLAQESLRSDLVAQLPARFVRRSLKALEKKKHRLRRKSRRIAMRLKWR